MKNKEVIKEGLEHILKCAEFEEAPISMLRKIASHVRHIQKLLGLESEEKLVHWVNDIVPMSVICRALMNSDDLGCMSLDEVTCPECLKSEEAQQIRRTL